MKAAGPSRWRIFAIMSRRKASSLAAKKEIFAPLFAALGDETRLTLVAKLCEGEPRSIADLTSGSNLSRQAISKHLQVLEGAGIVHSVRAGRENLYALDPKPIEDARKYLDQVSAQWDTVLARFKAFVEE
jgi:DNA-binding transcriptional ArsR family regulator